MTYFLFEHKSRPDPYIAFQLLRYMTKIWEFEITHYAPDFMAEPYDFSPRSKLEIKGGDAFPHTLPPEKEVLMSLEQRLRMVKAKNEGLKAGSMCLDA